MGAGRGRERRSACTSRCSHGRPSERVNQSALTSNRRYRTKASAATQHPRYSALGLPPGRGEVAMRAFPGARQPSVLRCSPARPQPRCRRPLLRPVTAAAAPPGPGSSGSPHNESPAQASVSGPSTHDILGLCLSERRAPLVQSHVPQNAPACRTAAAAAHLPPALLPTACSCHAGCPGWSGRS